MQLITVALIIIARGTYISQREGSITVTSYLARSADEINALWVTFKVLVYNSNNGNEYERDEGSRKGVGG